MKGSSNLASSHSSMAPGKSVMPPPSDAPDLSHLTPEERRIIESVMNRQKEEEQKDAEVLRKTEAKISTTSAATALIHPPRSEQSFSKPNSQATPAPLSNVMSNIVNDAVSAVVGVPAAGTTSGLLDCVCDVCKKTKFADGHGNACAKCRRKTCTRCGYQVNTGINQVQWKCSSCTTDAIGTESSLGHNTQQSQNVNSNPQVFAAASTSSHGPRRLLPRLCDEDRWSTFTGRSPQIRRRLPDVECKTRPNSTQLRPQHRPQLLSSQSVMEYDPWMKPSAGYHRPSSLYNESETSDSAFEYYRSAGSRISEMDFRFDHEYYSGESKRSGIKERFAPTHGHSPRSERIPRNSLEGSPYSANMNLTRPSAYNSQYYSISSSEEGSARFSHTTSPYATRSERGFPHRKLMRDPEQHSLYDEDEAVARQVGRPVQLRYGEVVEPYYDFAPTYGTSRERDIMSSPLRSAINERIKWQPSSDGRFLVGRMTLTKGSEPTRGDNGSLLGFKLIGGRRTQSGEYGAFITRVKPGSQANLVGQLRPGDEVLQLNGYQLRGLTAEEVTDVVNKCRRITQLDIVAQRALDDPSDWFGEEDVLSTSSATRDFHLPVPKLPADWERSQYPALQLELDFDPRRESLTVHLIGASNLHLQPFHSPSHSPYCNSYCRVRLMPGNDEMQYSKLIAQSNHPRWDQMFEFFGYSEQSICQEDLELTVWNCQSNTNEQNFIGEVVIDLSMADLTGMSYWYPLQIDSQEDRQSGPATPVFAADQAYNFDLNRSPRNRLLSTGSSRQADDIYKHSPRMTNRTHSPAAGHAMPRRRSGPIRKHPALHEEHLGHSDASECSDVSEFSRLSLTTTHSELNRGAHSDINKHTLSPRPLRDGHSRNKQDHHGRSRGDSRTENRAGASQFETHGQGKGSSSSECVSGVMQTGKHPKTNSLSSQSQMGDTGQAGKMVQPGKSSRPGIGHKFSTVLGRSSKSSSTSTLDKKSRSRFQRCEEVLPFGSSDQSFDASGDASTGGTDAIATIPVRRRLDERSTGSSGRMNKGPETAGSSSPVLLRNESHVGEFVEGLGPGQLVGRQVLGMPCLGEIQLSFYDRKGHLEVEVIRARGLQHKNTAKPLPSPYVKLHLLEGKISVEKLRTTTPPRRTLDPLYQQQMTFSMPYHGKVIQISVWGEYGRMDKKVFLGMCEVVLDDLDLSSVVFGWYKLFGMIAASVSHHRRHHRHQSNLQLDKDNEPSGPDTSELVENSKGRGKGSRKITADIDKRPSVSSDGAIRQKSTVTRKMTAKKSAHK